MQAKDIKYTIKDFYALPEGTCVELIEGVIYDMSPSPLRIHQKISMELSATIFNYIKKNKGKCEVYTAPFDVKLSESTVVIPDISVICDSSKLTDKGCSGAPDWIIEIVSSNAIHDYLLKLNLYQAYGVREYWIVNPLTRTVNVYALEKEELNDQYSFDDDIAVCIYDNLTINITELLKQ